MTIQQCSVIGCLEPASKFIRITDHEYVRRAVGTVGWAWDWLAEDTDGLNFITLPIFICCVYRNYRRCYQKE